MLEIDDYGENIWLIVLHFMEFEMDLITLYGTPNQSIVQLSYLVITLGV